MQNRRIEDLSRQGRDSRSFDAPGERPASGPPGLYVHIPFCLSKCPYCSFFSVTDQRRIPDFLAALFREMILCRNIFESFDTVYIGGGTPSLLSGDQLAQLFSGLRQNFEILEGSEITIEVNPADITHSFLKQMRTVGINRLNIGVQSFDNHLLAFLGRRHNGIQALQAVQAAAQAGFDNIGIDLMYGIPGQTRQSWKKTLEQAAALNIPHLSCYQLTIEPGTPLGSSYQQGLIEIPDNDELVEWFMETSEFLEESGYCHYEVSNFARSEPFISRHNSKYWRHVPYLGLGVAAHSFDGKHRWWNVRSLENYIRCLAKNEPPTENIERLTGEELQLESLFLGFRTRAGIDLADFSRKYGCDLLSLKKEQLEPLLAERFLIIEDGRLQPTRAGMALADSLALL